MLSFLCCYNQLMNLHPLIKIDSTYRKNFLFQLTSDSIIFNLKRFSIRSVTRVPSFSLASANYTCFLSVLYRDLPVALKPARV